MATSRVVRLVCCLLFRLLLPAALFIAAVVRYNALSFLYGVFLLICPLLRTPNPTSIRGGTGIYLRIVWIFGFLAVLAHAVFHITLTAIAKDGAPYGSMFPNCSFNEKLARQILVERLDNVPTIHIVRLILPDVIVFITGLLVYIICYKLLPTETQKPDELPTSTAVRSRRKRTLNDILQFFGEALVVLLLAASGIIVPSVFSSLYFLSFIFIATVWSLYGRLGRKFSCFRILLLIYSAAHLLVLHLYQFQFFQENVDPQSFIARLLGLTSVLETNCDYPAQMFFTDTSQWPYFVNPAILLCLYYTLAFEVRLSYTTKEYVLDEQDGEPVMVKGRRWKRRSRDEREVERDQDESQLEHLVQSEVRDYSSMEERRSETPTMLASDENDEGNDDSVDGQGVSKPKPKKDLKRAALVSVMVYIMRQSYVLSLIAMMAWSITFHSWLTFVLLLLACIIWMFPKSRHVCYVLSPFILFYAICLLIIQFVFGMNLTELPKEVNGIKLSDIGLKTFTYPCLQLALQIVYTLMFWLTLRQYVRERRHARRGEGEKYALEPVASPSSRKSIPEIFNFDVTDMVDGYDSNTMKFLGHYLWCLMCKYWILVCAAMLLVISIQEVVVYRIIYMVLFLYFVLSFQFMYTIWRVTMFVFWWVVIIYSMFVLIVLYTYQFEEFPGYWHNSTGLSYDTLADLGLEQFDTTGLFIKLLSPTSFLIIIIMQVHYFHTPFLKLSALDRFKLPRDDPPSPTVPSPTLETTDGGFTTDTDTEEPKKKKSWRAEFGQNFRKLWRFASGIWETVAWFLWRLGEIHIHKVVAFIIIMVAVYEVSAITAIYVILLSVLLPLTGCSFLLSHILQFWTAIVILAKMIYQLRLVDTSNWLSNCTDNATRTVYPFNQTIDNAVWVGLEKTNDIAYYLRNYIGVLLILVLERVIIYHQRQYYNKPGVVRPKTGIIFSQITRKEADNGLKSCVQYLLNYFFYKFGLEMCYIIIAITICVRVDAYSLLYAIILGILLALSRHASAIVWPVWTMLLVILLPVQFLICLGLPLFLCYEYPWTDISYMKQELEKWLYLPDYFPGKPEPDKLVADFFMLLFVCLQWRVFRIESARGTAEAEGGSNDDIIPEVEAKTKIPVEDFTTEIKSYLDVIKNFVFTYMFWVTLAIVFIAGTTRINLFSMGYVIAVFCFMWFGQEFLIKPLRALVRAWNFLIGYCFIVLFLKAGLQLPGCVYIRTVVDNACWLVQLLGLTCLRPSANYPDTQAQCKIEDDNTGLAWDVVVFVFLLLQKRIYTSHYFRHVVADFQAQNRLASRGAELINKILMREVTKQKIEEKQLLEKIKAKMNQLKEKQKHLKENYIEPEDHFAAIRSGDYYLFEESEDELEHDDEGVDIIKFGMGEERDKDAPPTPMELISTAIDTDIGEAVKKSESFDDDQDRPRGSKPSSPRDEIKTVDDDKQEQEEEEEKDSVPSKVMRVFNFILALLKSLADWLTSLFNRISRNYRLVASKLKDDHIRVKQQIQSEQFILTETELETTRLKTAEGGQDHPDGAAATSDLVEITIEPVKLEQSDGNNIAATKSESSLMTTDLDKFEDDETQFEESQPRLYRLLVATYYVLIAKSELVCYFLMILNHMLTASLLSLPLPIFVFLWGMLSVPRPTKTFWITVITYTEAVVVVKYLFQFGFFPWNGTVSEDPFWPPRIIGVEQKDEFAAMDLVLLLALFIHRTILKRYGLWRDAEWVSEEKETEAPTSSIEEPAAITDGKAETTVELVDGKPVSKVLASPESTTDLEGGFADKSKGEKTSVVSLILSPFTTFYKQLTCPDYNATTDVYAPMFACDFIGFLIVVFGYWAFGPSQGGTGGDVTSYITEDRVPVPFLIMLLIQFVFIVVDRALYLKKNVLGKFIFQIILVIIVHVWMFFILPYSTTRSFFDNKPAQLWYFTKCVYFALSAYQIRSAYPTRILGNFLTKKYNYLNLFLFKGFLAIPFVLELRTLMDWIWTDTTMAIGSWLTMEDIYANIYVLKCWREAEKKYPTPRATPKKAVIKYGVGGLLLFVIIFIIWFPLVIFSFANTVYEANPPKECTVSLSLGGFQPLFTVSGQQNSIRVYSEGEYKQLRSKFNKNGLAVGFLSNYDAPDVTEILLDGKSTSLWGISPPSRKSLIEALENNKTDVMMEFHVTFTRTPHSQAGETLSNQFNHKLTYTEKRHTADLINGSKTDPVTIADLFPRYMRLASKSADPSVQLLGTEKNSYSNVAIKLESSNDSLIEEWWQVEDVQDPSANPSKLIRIITFNDRVAPAGLSIISGYGIIGLYVTFILLIGRFLRMGTTGQHLMIQYQELPYVDNVLRLCLDLYLVREMKEHRLEEDLYAKLIFFYRSSETRIKWTRMPMEQIIETKKRL